MLGKLAALMNLSLRLKEKTQNGRIRVNITNPIICAGIGPRSKRMCCRTRNNAGKTEKKIPITTFSANMMIGDSVDCQMAITRKFLEIPPFLRIGGGKCRSVGNSTKVGPRFTARRISGTQKQNL